MPDGVVASGWPAVQNTSREIGVEYDPWQQSMNRCILAKDRFGLYACEIVVMSIPRQVGKTFDVGGIVFSDSIIHPGTTTVWTAHRFKVARESFNELRALAKSPKLAPHIDYDDITTAAGNECIPFRNGSRIVFAARERGAIRGFTKVRRLVLDEGQILTEAAMSDLAPTQNQAANPQIIIMGTPPKPSDPGEVFTNLRNEALAGSSEGLMYVELSADDDADLDDVEQWGKANPSLHHRTPVSAIRRLRKLLSNDDDFRREALGIWPTEDNAPTWGVIPRVDWTRRKTDETEAQAEEPGWLVGTVTLAVEMPQDRSAASVVAAGECREGGHGIKVLARENGVGWVLDSIVDLHEDPTVDFKAVVIDPGGPAAELIDDLEDAGVPVLPCKYADLKVANATFMTEAVECMPAPVRHQDDERLTDAVARATWRPAGDTRVVDRRAGVDVSPFTGGILALWGHLQAEEEPVTADQLMY